MKQQLTRFLNKVLSYFPTAIPVGLTEFETWADSILELSGLPISRESAHQAVANMIIHVGPKKGSDKPQAYLPKNWFVHALRKGAANQIASHVFYEIQTAQKARLSAAQAAATDKVGEDLKQQALGEATASTETVNEKIGLQ